MAFWGADSGAHADILFERSFGGEVNNEEVYYNPWMSIDKRQDIGQALMQKAIQKAPSITATTGGAGTAGTALIPVWVDPNIIDQVRKTTPLVELIPRRAIRGKTYDYNKLTAYGGATWKLEDASLNEDVDTYSRVSVPMKYGYAVGRVTGPAIAGMAGYADALQLDLAAKTQQIKELEENTIINGDVGTYATEYDGLIQTISATTNKSTTYVSLADIRAELATTWNARGIVTLCVTDAATHNNIKGVLQDFTRQPAPPAEGFPFGIPGAFSIDGVNFIKSMHMPTSSGSRRILFLDMRYIFMGVLQDITFQELAMINDSNKYMLKVYEALVVTFESAMSQIYGIK